MNFPLNHCLGTVKYLGKVHYLRVGGWREIKEIAITLENRLIFTCLLHNILFDLKQSTVIFFGPLFAEFATGRKMFAPPLRPKQVYVQNASKQEKMYFKSVWKKIDRIQKC